jgi:hypothetical protein
MLDDILRERYVPEMPTNLAYRIIEAAKPRGEEKGFTWAAFQRALTEIFVIPQPAFAMAVILLLGIVLGAYFGTEQSLTFQIAQDNFSSFITAENNFDYGDFL